MVTLRDYQQVVYDQIRTEFAHGKRSVLVVLPCRSGKSYLMASIAEHAKSAPLILAHRRELLKQHEELFHSLGIQARFASVFTEINHVGEHGSPALVMIDEAHLSEASSYRKVMEGYSNAYLIGFTATPQRLSGERLSLYESLVQGISVKELIRQGAIAEYDYYAPDVGLDLSAVGMVAGEYNNSQLTEVMCQSRLYGDFIDIYKRYALNRQTLAYCVSIKHAKAVAEAFNAEGIQAVEVDSKTPSAVRNEAIERFRNGEYTVLVNVGLLSEGITLPEADVCMLLRPTQSLALFIQQSMRCLTPREGKRALILDCVGNYQRHGLPDTDRQWSLEGRVRHRMVTDEGAFTMRSCPVCYRVFTGDICPYCGTPYVPKDRELKQIKEVELRKINEEEAVRMERKRKEMRMEVGRARSIADLIKIQRARNYNQNWVWVMAKKKGLKR